MTDPTTPPTVTVLEHVFHLRSVPSDVPEMLRVRAALKSLLRRFGLRCVDYYAKDMPLRVAGGRAKR